MNRWLIRVILGTVLAGFAYGAFSVASCIYYANEAEKTLHACVTVSDALEQFVLDHEGEWPRSWEQLRKWTNSTESLDRADYVRGWSDEWVARVQVDFAADPAALAKLQIADYKVEGFRAIEPIGPVFDSFDRNFYLIVEASRKFHPAHSGL